METFWKNHPDILSEFWVFCLIRENILGKIFFYPIDFAKLKSYVEVTIIKNELKRGA